MRGLFPQDAIRTKFLYYFFEYHYERIRNLGHGANQKNLSAEILKGCLVSYPEEHEEQDEIIYSLEAVHRKLLIHLKKQEMHFDLFRTLLHQMMTASIRVNELGFPTLDDVA